MNDTIPDSLNPTGEAISLSVSGPSSFLDSYIGRQIGHLRIESCIGEGGFGAVYRAVHETLGTPFAVKVLHAKHLEKSVMVQRFEREARTIAQLTHAHVIQVSDFGQFDDGSYYLVMEFLEGMPLDDWLAERRSFAYTQLISLVEQLCSALSYVHSRGIVHRDLKPANIFLSFSQGQKGLRTKLLDFGIAGLSDEPTLTKTGVVLGSPLYMSPEQISGYAKTADVRADLYSFGVILFHLLTGTPPFVGTDMMGILYNHMHAPLPQLSEVRPAFTWSPFLQDFLKKATAKAPYDRFQNAEEMLMAFQRAMEAQRALTPNADFPQYPLGKELLSATKEPQTPRLRLNRQTMLVFQQKLATQKRTLFWASLFAVLFVGLGVAGTWYFLRIWPHRQSKPKEKHSPKKTPSSHLPKRTIVVPPRAPLPSRAPLHRVPAVPKEALLEIKVTPEEAEVFVDGRLLQCPPCSLRRTLGSSFSLKVVLEGYISQEITLTPTPENTVFPIQLARLPAKKRKPWKRKRSSYQPFLARPRPPHPPRKAVYDPFLEKAYR
ncbi:MAG: serine/threonine protein kinase [Myxococcales bacterium]|nr:serine/threonine protein kinase [Myxococcales bacterium]